MIFDLTPEELQAIDNEEHYLCSPMVKFCLGYMGDHREDFIPQDVTRCFGYYLQVERDMVNALCIHLGVSTERCKEKFVVICRWLKAMAKIKEQRWFK